MENFITVYYGEFELLRICTNFNPRDAQYSREGLAVIRMRCKDALSMMGWSREIIDGCILYAFDNERLCKL